MVADEMTVQRRIRRRAITWLAVLLIFLILLVLANQFTEGERFYGLASSTVIAVAVLGLLAVYAATAGTGLWRVPTRHIAVMAVGATLYAILAYLFNNVIDISVGPVALRPQICIPILLGYAFTPITGFFAGAVGSLMGDFVTGWGVFPAWHIGSGLTGLVPGLLRLGSREPQRRRYLSAMVVLLMAAASAAVFLHPRAPEPWTGQVEDFSSWGWILVVESAVMVANTFLLERVSVLLAAVNLWGALGIIAGNAFASLAHIWINEYGLATAVIGELAPSVATDILNLIIFAPLILAVYSVVRPRRR